MALASALPLSPLAGCTGVVALPASLLALVATTVALYLGLVRIVKGHVLH